MPPLRPPQLRLPLSPLLLPSLLPLLPLLVVRPPMQLAVLQGQWA